MPTSPQPATEAPPRALPEAWRVEVFRRPGAGDPEGAEALQAISELGVVGVRSVRSGRGFLLSPELAEGDARRVVRELLADPVLDEARLIGPGLPPPGVDAHRILVARRPGVMDPVAETVERALARTGLAALPDGSAPRALSFRAWEVEGSLSATQLKHLGRSLFANEVIEELLIDREELHFAPPRIEKARALTRVPLREAGEEELERISREGVLSLTVLEMRAIQAHYRELGREPTACELETLAQTWSEHCKHKTFTGVIHMDGEVIDNLLKQTIVRATEELAKPWCISVFHDNAGIVEFADGWDACFKVETHNHPSAIDPYGGAGTGIGGVIRDILGCGLGAKPIANTDCFFVGPLDLPAEELPRGTLHPRRILRGVVAGVRDYGNRMGIPTVNGGVWVDPRFVGNPLVFCGTVGLLPRACATKSVEPGDVVVVAGGRTGRDGIHGATFSSVELHDESVSVSSSAVQIGDPITEKRVLDALLVARDRGLYRAVTDCGAGGLSSAVGEMGEDCGAEVDLEKVPLKYPGLSPAEVWISEAQERMVFAVPPDRLDELLAVFEAEDVEATAIGRFTGDGRLLLRCDGEPVGELDMAFLHEGTPRPERHATWSAPSSPDPGCPEPDDFGEVILALLCRPDVASKDWIVTQYDHEVQGTSAIKPLVGARGEGPGDAAVIQPLESTRRGLAISCGASATRGPLNPRAMALASIDEALRNVVAVGGDPGRCSLLDNFAWGSCDRPRELGALVHAARACYEGAMAYGTPFISGKDSLNNEFRVGEETFVVPPTLLISALAIVPDVARCVTMDLKAPGNALYLLGTTRSELGGSQYLAQLGLEGGRVPRPELDSAPALLAALHAAIGAGLVRSCHDLSEGGLAVAAAEMVLAGQLGAELHLAEVPRELGEARCHLSAALLFSESCTRFLVELAPGDEAAFAERFSGHPCARLGAVGEEPRLRLLAPGGELLADLSWGALRAAHRGGFRG